jgi:hypothetical protein
MQVLLRTTSRAVGRAALAGNPPSSASAVGGLSPMLRGGGFGGMLSVRGIGVPGGPVGAAGVPENYGQVKDGPGTKFLGTPDNHREVREGEAGDVTRTREESQHARACAPLIGGPRLTEKSRAEK